jgi:hypothetical protein
MGPGVERSHEGGLIDHAGLQREQTKSRLRSAEEVMALSSRGRADGNTVASCPGAGGLTRDASLGLSHVWPDVSPAGRSGYRWLSAPSTRRVVGPWRPRMLLLTKPAPKDRSSVQSKVLGLQGTTNPGTTAGVASRYGHQSATAVYSSKMMSNSGSVSRTADKLMHHRFFDASAVSSRQPRTGRPRLARVLMESQGGERRHPHSLGHRAWRSAGGRSTPPVGL